MRRGAPAPEGALLRAGCYGKMPGAGDFVARRLPGEFADRWDPWVREGMRESEKQFGQDWRETYLSMPAWRFLLEPGIVAAAAFTGVMVPSVDAVGRFFPLTIAAMLPAASPADELPDIPALFRRAARWLERLEAIALEAIAPGTRIAALEGALAAAPFPAQGMGWGGPGAGRSGWLTERSEVMDRTLLVATGLPSATQFCGLMSGDWSGHGWEPVAGLQGA